MTNEIVTSQDGSHTLISEQFGVGYHSKYGAIDESNVVFIDACLTYLVQEKLAQPISIFEMGFGTGLNALLTYKYAEEHGTPINYITVEAYPIELDQARQLNYPNLLDVHPDILVKMHQATSKVSVQLSDNFVFTKVIGNLQDLSYDKVYHGIYYDAFAPNSQPELWSEDRMAQLYSFLKEDGILTTYCAKGSFKRALKAAGFRVEGLPGPTGKREITRAIK